MIDMNGPRSSLAVSLPVGLVEQMTQVASSRGMSLDELVQEACLAYCEPIVWQQVYDQWCRNQPGAEAPLTATGKPA